MKQETMEKLENVISKNLDKIQQGTDDENREELVTDTCNLLDRLNEAEGKQMEYWDKEERRELEKEKNETMAEIEREKGAISKPKMVLEIARIVVPVVVPMVAYGFYQAKLLKFEETGRVNSTAGRELHLPRFFK